MSAVLPCVDRLDLRRLEPPEPLALVLDALGWNLARAVLTAYPVAAPGAHGRFRKK
jgi:hypothetical protein